MDLATIVSQTLSLLTVLGQIIIVVLLISFLLKKTGKHVPLLAFVQKNAILFAFIVAFIATTGSLFYSEIAGYDPCKLCWFQRIFMYPQVLLLGIALLKKDRGIAPYCIVLSVVGTTIAAYHYLLQLGIAPELSCGVVGYSVSCAQLFVMHFGYITIPMMALTAFLMIVFFLLCIPMKKLEVETK